MFDCPEVQYKVDRDLLDLSNKLLVLLFLSKAIQHHNPSDRYLFSLENLFVKSYNTLDFLDWRTSFIKESTSFDKLIWKKDDPEVDPLVDSSTAIHFLVEIGALLITCPLPAYIATIERQRIRLRTQS